MPHYENNKSPGHQSQIPTVSILSSLYDLHILNKSNQIILLLLSLSPLMATESNFKPTIDGPKRHVLGWNGGSIQTQQPQHGLS